MAIYTIEDLERAAYRNIAPGQWTEELPLVEKVRKGVDRYIDNGGIAYGFSTLFGHLDNNRLLPKDQKALMQSHNIGVPEVISSEMMRSITTMKLCQLSHGKSGISPETYMELISLFGNTQAGFIDMDASYGSGDVVPASWWARSMFGTDEFDTPGDVMALINGNFVASGVLLHHRRELRFLIDAAIHLIDRSCSVLGVSSVQLPVSTRDTLPLKHLVDSAFVEIDETLVKSANSASNNPVFSLCDEGRNIEVTSNSSFLNFDLSSTLHTLSYCILMSSAYMRSATLHLSVLSEKVAKLTSEKVLFVQYPKISKSYYDKMASLLDMSPSYAQSESFGVEDIADNNLMKISLIEKSIPLFRKQLSILDKICGHMEVHSKQKHHVSNSW